jgi:hypothetical protein
MNIRFCLRIKFKTFFPKMDYNCISKKIYFKFLKFEFLKFWLIKLNKNIRIFFEFKKYFNANY